VAKKKIIHRLPRHAVAEEKEISPASSLDMDDDSALDGDFPTASEGVIKKMVIKPAGFPIKPLDAPEKLQVSVSDPALFQAYASEQWLGLSVKVDDYLFDQLIIPDFAFKITKITPKTAFRIGAETQFAILNPPIQKPTFKPVNFKDIVGNKQALDKAKIIVKFLKEPEKFGEWAPKNILFYGCPGTGKTLTAKAIATAADCTFLARKGTTLIGLHVGDGASKIHELYALAKKHAPSIIFIDELDSIGLHRSFQNVRGDVIEVATALLAEMDGLESSEGVITIGATNSLDLLDPGLRSRFEEEIDFPIPSEQERFDMLELFTKKLPIPLDADLREIAKQTDKWSGRDLHEKLVKVAVHQAIQNDLPIVSRNLLLKIIKDIGKQQAIAKPPSGLFS
jgi:AAA family ATPase